ncbi:MAG: magnesium transporter CorA [Cloacibacterium sp.]|nr:magnesium transporter CorA [Cloacibacterium sp.]
MIHKTLYKNNQFEWVDIQELKADELDWVSEKYGINRLLLEDCIDSYHLPKAEDLGEVKFILARQSSNAERKSLGSISDVSTKVGIFVKNNLILTVHRLAIVGQERILSDLQKEKFENPNPYKIALEIGLEIFKSFETENRLLAEQMDIIENEVFTMNKSTSLEIKKLYRFKRKVGLNLKLLNLSGEWVSFIEKFPINPVEIKDLKDSHVKAVSDFEHLNYQTTNLISLFLALSDQKNNEAMKVLSVISLYFLPITFLAGFYGMNFKYMPELESPYGYFGIIAVMLLTVIGIYIYIKRKKL